jgi:hypothetical protein
VRCLHLHGVGLVALDFRAATRDLTVKQERERAEQFFRHIANKQSFGAAGRLDKLASAVKNAIVVLGRYSPTIRRRII